MLYTKTINNCIGHPRRVGNRVEFQIGDNPRIIHVYKPGDIFTVYEPDPTNTLRYIVSHDYGGESCTYSMSILEITDLLPYTYKISSSSYRSRNNKILV